MSRADNRQRGEAYTGNGYGSRRYLLFVAAREQIERSITEGFYCEAITIIESVIADRLESRLSWLTRNNVGFKMLGLLINESRRREDDQPLMSLLDKLDDWRKRRNKAIHELVKVEASEPDPDWRSKPSDWTLRMSEIEATAKDGYELLKSAYHCVADLNTCHTDRVFDPPFPSGQTS